MSVRLVMKWRFSDRVRHQMVAFMNGFNEFVPHDLLKVFDENEVEVISFFVSPCCAEVIGVTYTQESMYVCNVTKLQRRRRPRLLQGRFTQSIRALKR